MPNITLAKEMLEILKADYRIAAKSPSRMVGHINLTTYKKKFGVIDADIQAYIDTLPLMKIIYPNCVRCGREWQSLEKRIWPHGGNGSLIEWVDYFTMWCSGTAENAKGFHDYLTYYQSRPDRCSFEMEVDDLHGKDYVVHWNCHCGVKECYEKNVIALQGNDKNKEEYKIIKVCKEIPFDISREALYKLIEPNLSLL